MQRSIVVQCSIDAEFVPFTNKRKGALRIEKFGIFIPKLDSIFQIVIGEDSMGFIPPAQDENK